MSWLSNLFLDHYNAVWPILGGLGLFGMASWWLGLGSVMRIIATAFDVISPLLKAILEALIEYTKVLYKGLKVVLNSWSAMLLVVTLVMGSWAYGRIPAKVETKKCEKEKTAIVKNLRQYQKKYPSIKPEKDWRWLWE